MWEFERRRVSRRRDGIRVWWSGDGMVWPASRVGSAVGVEEVAVPPRTWVTVPGTNNTQVRHRQASNRRCWIDHTTGRITFDGGEWWLREPLDDPSTTLG